MSRHLLRHDRNRLNHVEAEAGGWRGEVGQAAPLGPEHRPAVGPPAKHPAALQAKAGGGHRRRLDLVHGTAGGRQRVAKQGADRLGHGHGRTLLEVDQSPLHISSPPTHFGDKVRVPVAGHAGGRPVHVAGLLRDPHLAGGMNICSHA
jgi:hypothetical protein